MSFTVPPEGGTQDAPSRVSDSLPATQASDKQAPLWPSLFPIPERNTPAELPASVIAAATDLKAGQTPAKPQDGAPKPQDGGPKPHDGAPKRPDNVRFDAGGYATDINYPDGTKSRHIDRDAKTHEAQSLTTKTADTTTTLVNKDGRWLLNMQGVQLPVNGKLEVSKDGEVAIKTNGSNVWKVEKTDGTVVDEKENADGVRVRLDASGQAVRIVRGDGSAVEKINDNTIMETRPGQKPVVWTKSAFGGANPGAEAWKSDAGQSGRKHMQLNGDGNLSFTDGSGIKHKIDGRNLETMEGAGLAKIAMDKQNRPIEVDLGDKIRKYDYFDDKSNDVKTLTIINKKSGKSETHARNSKESDQWTNTSWRGEIAVGQDGVHSVRTHPGGQPVAENTRWDSYHADGRVSSDTLAKDGSRASYEKGSDNLISVRSKDGVRIDRVAGDKGKASIKYYNPRIGDTVTWTKGEDGKYKSDSSLYKDARSNLSFNEKGELTYSNDKGQKVSEGKDGAKRVGLSDGTVLEYGADNQLNKAIRGQVERSFNRENGQIKSVVDRDTKSNKETPVFLAGAKGAETRSHVHLAENGDLSYQNADQSAVLERANGLHLELDKDGDMTLARSDSGSRSFRYINEHGNKTLASVQDRTKTDKGEQSESFTRVINPDGRLASEFRSDKGGASRYGIMPCADGDYEYQSAGNKQVQTARLARSKS